MIRPLQRNAAAAALVASLLTSGCADLPVVGPAFEAVKPALSMLDPILAPIKGMLGMSEAPPPSTMPSPRPRPRRPKSETAVQTTGASGSVGAAAVENSEAQLARIVERNKEFDRLRTTGLMQLYGGETRMAIETFEKAAKLRPQDAHIQELIELAKNPPRTERSIGGADGVPAVPGGFLQ